MAEHEEQATKEERKDARKGTLLLLKRLRKQCDAIDKVSDWPEVVANVEKLLDDHACAIPAASERRIRKALNLSDASVKGMNQACQVLQYEVEGLAKYLRPVPGAASILAGGLIVVAAAALVITIASNVLAVSITLRNEGCSAIPVAAALGSSGAVLVDNPILATLAIQVPAGIEANGTAVLSVPPFDLEYDNESDATVFRLTVLGQELPLSVVGATAVLFDDESITGRRDRLVLGGGMTHTLTIRCEN